MEGDIHPPGRIRRAARITREMVRAEPGALFVFGDNMARAGYGGQAREMRGEPNAVGVPTKWRPERNSGAYFTNAAWQSPDVRYAITWAFNRMRHALDAGRDVVIPADGIGTGLAELPARAPELHARIERAIARLEATYGTA